MAITWLVPQFEEKILGKSSSTKRLVDLMPFPIPDFEKGFVEKVDLLFSFIMWRRGPLGVITSVESSELSYH